MRSTRGVLPHVPRGDVVPKDANASVVAAREDTQEGLVGLCEAGCRVLSVSAAPALEREFYA